MFKIKTYLDKSKIQGIGLFSDEDTKKNSIVYIPNEKLDLSLSNSIFQKLSRDEKNTIKHFGYKTKNGEYHLSFDNIRFCNHSKSKNNISIGKKGYLYATRDILKGEELLQDYSEFEFLRSSLR